MGHFNPAGLGQKPSEWGKLGFYSYWSELLPWEGEKPGVEVTPMTPEVFFKFRFRIV